MSDGTEALDLSMENSTWCEYCDRRAAVRQITVNTSIGTREIAVCKECDALIREDGYIEKEYRGDDDDEDDHY